MTDNTSVAVKWSSDLTRWGEKVMDPKLHAKLYVQETAIRIGKYVIMGTPVKTGLARGNWRLSFLGRVGAGVLTTLDPTGQVSIARIEASARTFAARSSFSLYNNLPYIYALEHGHSTQAPSGMVGLALARVKTEETDISRAVEIRLKREVSTIGVG